MPQVIESIAALANSLPGYIEDAQKTITSMIEKQQIPQDVLKQVDTYSAQLQDTLVNLLKKRNTASAYHGKRLCEQSGQCIYGAGYCGLSDGIQG